MWQPPRASPSSKWSCHTGSRLPVPGPCSGSSLQPVRALVPPGSPRPSTALLERLASAGRPPHPEPCSPSSLRCSSRRRSPRPTPPPSPPPRPRRSPSSSTGSRRSSTPPTLPASASSSSVTTASSTPAASGSRASRRRRPPPRRRSSASARLRSPSSRSPRSRSRRRGSSPSRIRSSSGCRTSTSRTSGRATNPVRIANLLEHTSGFDDNSLMSYANNDPTPLTLAQGLALDSATRVSRWRPGTIFSYCNTGPAIVARIAEEIEGKQLGADRPGSLVRPDRDDDGDLHAAGHDEGAGGHALPRRRRHAGALLVRLHSPGRLDQRVGARHGRTTCASCSAAARSTGRSSCRRRRSNGWNARRRR